MLLIKIKSFEIVIEFIIPPLIFTLLINWLLQSIGPPNDDILISSIVPPFILSPLIWLSLKIKNPSLISIVLFTFKIPLISTFELSETSPFATNLLLTSSDEFIETSPSTFNSFPTNKLLLTLKSPVAFNDFKFINPEISTFPFNDVSPSTCNNALGSVVPIPNLPSVANLTFEVLFIPKSIVWPTFVFKTVSPLAVCRKAKDTPSLLQSICANEAWSLKPEVLPIAALPKYDVISLS